MSGKESKKGFVWYSLRISFYLMIVLLLLALVFDFSFETNRELFLAFLVGVSIFFNFVVSIIHLVRYKKKPFAIVALVFSSIFLLIVLVRIFSLDYSSQILLDEKDQVLENDYYQSYAINLYDSSYLNLNFSSNSNSNIYLLEGNEFYRYEKGELFYYLESSENSTIYFLNNFYLSSGNYNLIIETTNSPITYNLFVEVSPVY
ncbi:MAG: hypothetical protein Q8P15_02000 [Nanoarchaeota archaeon]|nr:hypothetical protein [Nanoarchaeota archaeon]